MKTKSVKKNYIFNLIYQILLVIIPLITTPYLSRVLFKEGIGQYSFTFSIITYFVLFATFGFDNYAQREIAKHQNDTEQQSITFWEILIGKSLPVLGSLCIHFVLLLLNVYGNYQFLMQILTINIIAVAFDVSFYFQGNEDFGKLVLRNILIKLLATISIFVFVKSYSDLWIYALISSISVIVSNLALWPSLLKRIKKVNLKNLNPFKHLPNALKLFIPALAISIYTVLDKTLIGVITHSDAQNGYYEQAEKIVKMSMTLITCLGAVMIPRNSHEISQGNHEQVKNNIYKAFNFVWLIGFPMMFGIIAVANNLVPWFLGSDFNYSSILLMWFAPLILIIGSSNVLGMQYMLPYGKEKHYTISLIIGSFINLILNIILIYFYQSLGATIATLIAEIFVTASMIFFVRKEISFKHILKTLFKPLLASLIMFACLSALNIFLAPSLLNTIIIILSGCLVYAIAILLLKEKTLISAIKNFKNKLNKNNH